MEAFCKPQILLVKLVNCSLTVLVTVHPFSNHHSPFKTSGFVLDYLSVVKMTVKQSSLLGALRRVFSSQCCTAGSKCIYLHACCCTGEEQCGCIFCRVKMYQIWKEDINYESKGFSFQLFCLGTCGSAVKCVMCPPFHLSKENDLDKTEISV